MPPLTNLRVLDLTRLLPGPYATLVLSDLGAEVINIEDPLLGDYLRALPPLAAGETGGMFAALNRGKRSVVIDLKAAAGVALLRRLCARADVLVESFRPGVLERLGIAPKQLCAGFPRLVVCSISAFGQTGPWRGVAGHDLGCLALSGALSLCGTDPAHPPALPGVQLADLMGGAQTAIIAILAALLERERSGRGRALDVSMTEGAMALVLPHLGALAAGGERQARGDDVLSGSHACYRVYACLGGGAFALGALEPKFWQRFCAAARRPEWEGRQFDRALAPEVDALFLTRTREAWSALLGPADCCAAPVLEPHELEAHPQHAARDLFVRSGSLRLLRTQPALVKTSELPRGAGPSHGAHTEEVLREAGLGDAELAALREAAVIPAAC